MLRFTAPALLMFIFIGVTHPTAYSQATHEGGSPQDWNPNFDEDALISMPDLLPLLGIFGSEWNGENARATQPHVVLLDWTGREDEVLVLPADADAVVFNAGVNDLSDPAQQFTSIRHIAVQSQEEDPSALHMHPQILLLDRGVNAQGQSMKYGTEYILHFPDGTRGMVSTNSVGAMSSSGTPIRTAAYLIHSGGKVYVGQ